MATSPVPPAAAPEAEAAFALLGELVALHPSNLEDPVRDRYEKPRYGVTLDRIEREARAIGLATRRYDPASDPAHTGEFRGIPRPNLVVDLDVGASERVLILAHYDVVPVAEEQLGRWRSDPKVLTPRPDGRWYGRGSNDDLGSGVVGSLLALRALRAGPPPPRNVRLLVCCDEETGGAGGIEALRHRDAALAEGDPDRFVAGDVALIPDGSPHAIPASSGVAFLDGSFAGPVALGIALSFGERLRAMQEDVARFRSRYASPDYPDHGAPAPVLTGRATVTRFDWTSAPGPAGVAVVERVHAETDAANFIPEAVTLVVRGPPERTNALLGGFRRILPEGYRLVPAAHSAVAATAGATAWQVVGEGGHGGSPHRARNPVPVTLDLLADAVARDRLDGTIPGEATFAVDLRLIPEATFAEGLDPALAGVRRWAEAHAPSARLEAPPARARTGYALPLDDPWLLRLAGILARRVGASGTFGEYGGTDASSLAGLRTPLGRPLPAIVFGSMDRASRIHDAEESVDPRLLLGIAGSLVDLVRAP